MSGSKIPTLYEVSVPERHGVDLPAPDVPSPYELKYP